MLAVLREKVSDLPLGQGIAVFLNPYSYLRLRRSSELLQQVDRIYVDGAALVLALRCAGIRTERRSMDLTSMAPEVLERASRETETIALVGGEAGIAQQAGERLQAILGPLNFVRIRSGYFADGVERAQEIENLAQTGPDVVLAGMGSPLQERFLVDLQRAGWRGTGYTCGGFLHQTASSATGQYYPRAFRHARWLYRMLDEPKLVPRYLLLYPWFVAVFVHDVIKDRWAAR